MEEEPIETNYQYLESQTEHRVDSKSLKQSESSDSSIIMPEYKIKEGCGKQESGDPIETVEPENTQTEDPGITSPDNDESRTSERNRKVQ